MTVLRNAIKLFWPWIVAAILFTIMLYWLGGLAAIGVIWLFVLAMGLFVYGFLHIFKQ